MLKTWTFIFVAAAFAVASLPARADELAVQKGIEEKAVTLLIAGNVEELDRWITGLLKSGEKTPAGILKASLVFEGIHNLSYVEIRNPVWNRIESVADDYLKVQPDSPNATILRASVLVAHAWAYRGFAFADDVTKVSWQPYAVLMSQAKDVLDKKPMTKLANPEWYALRAGVAVDFQEGLDAVRKLGDESLEAAPEYQNAYAQVFRFMQPKWGGTTELATQWVDSVIKKTNDKEGTQAYGRLYFGMVEYLGGNYIKDHLAQAGVNWPRLKASLKEIEIAYPDSYNWNVERVMTCSLGSNDEIKAVLRAHPKSDIASVTISDSPEWQRECEKRAFGEKGADSPI
jgi:hypothetical protein